MVPFEAVLGPLTPTAPILGAFDARVGYHRGQPVWLFWRREDGDASQPATFWIAMSVGHPLEGYIMVDGVLRDRPPVSDAGFFDVFQVSITPADVAPRVLDTSQTRAHVQRVFRGGGGARVMLSEGYLCTPASFLTPALLARWRDPQPGEVHGLVDDVAHLAERFRVAFETRYAEIAQTQGEAAAHAWHAQARMVAEATLASKTRMKACINAVAAGFAFLLLLAAAVIAWLVR
jgi:hypothetical protein